MIVKPIKLFIEYCESLDVFRTAAIMTLFVLFRYQTGAWTFSIINPILFCCLMIFPILLYKEQFWLIVTAICGGSIILSWYDQSNHTFLLFYWILSLFLSLFSTNRLKFLAESSRLLIGLSFLFAFFWKIFSNDFVSGMTMQYFMVASAPLGITSGLLTGLRPDQISHNITLIDQVLQGAGGIPFTLHSSSRVGAVAQVLTAATQCVEGGLAVVFLMPLRERWKPLREWGLALFFLTAYLFLPVPPFTTLLACLGYVLSTTAPARAFYLVAFFAYQLADLAFTRFLPPIS